MGIILFINIFLLFKIIIVLLQVKISINPKLIYIKYAKNIRTRKWS